MSVEEAIVALSAFQSLLYACDARHALAALTRLASAQKNS